GCQIEIGREVAASKVAASQWMEVANQCLLKVQIYDLKTALAEVSLQSRQECGEAGLLAAIQDVTGELSRRNGGDATASAGGGASRGSSASDNGAPVAVQAVARPASPRPPAQINVAALAAQLP